jgi:hypothetical protein
MSPRPRAPELTLAEMAGLDKFRSERQRLASKPHRWPELATTLHKIATNPRPFTIEELPPDFGDFVRWLYIESHGVLGYFTDSLSSAALANDGRAVAREALKIKNIVVDVPTSTRRRVHAEGGPLAAKARRENAELVARLGVSKLADYERQKGMTLTSKSSLESRKQAAKATHQSLRNVNRILKNREAILRS